MISVDEALERILSYFDRLEPEERPVPDALGQVLAEDVESTLDIPPLDNTAMDGYAVRAADTEGASEANPVRLRVSGELAAGYIFDGEVTPGSAVRIMTGAPIPRGADAVVPFEETDESSTGSDREFGTFAKSASEVGVLKAAKLGANIRRAGEDVGRGTLVLPQGTVLRPAQIGVLASLGKATVRVIRRPIVAILSTGDELLQPGQPVEPGKIYDSNAYSVAAMVRESGGIPRTLGIATDTVDALTAKIGEGLDADMLITSAGVSRGDYDVVKEVLAKEGDIDFWTVRMKPGKPLAFGAFPAGDRKVPHIGLPGNPVSSMITFELFGRPAVYKMLGKSGWQRPTVRAVAEERIVNTDGRRVYARAIVSQREGRYYASLTGPQGSGILTSMAQANALAVVPEEVAAVEAGDEVECLLLD
ncbi:MAG: molybdopterin molybdotransferase MoeA [Chloroflexi bacterium]|nr:molybdopterin molybdotransferase MoeA [Chloroflexota bacterium]